MKIMRVPKRRRYLRLLVYTAGLGLLILILWCATLYVIINRFDGEPAGKQPQPADVGIVLGATLWNNQPSPGLKERLDHALTLYQAGLYSHIIVTGGLDNNGATLTEAEGMRNYLMKQGVPADLIQMDPLSTSTYENLLFSRSIMKAEGWHTAIIVTHRYHGSRSLNIAHALGYEQVQVSITDSKVLNLSYHKSREVLAYTKWLAQKWFLHVA